MGYDRRRLAGPRGQRLRPQHGGRLYHHLLECSVLPLDEGLHVRLPGIVQRLLLVQEGRPILEGDLLQPMSLPLGELLDLRADQDRGRLGIRVNYYHYGPKAVLTGR